MTCDVYALEFEQICCVCYLPDCIEFQNVSWKKNVCPLRIVKRLRLTAEQGKQLSQVARIRGYRPYLFLKMAEITAERNLLAVGR